MSFANDKDDQRRRKQNHPTDIDQAASRPKPKKRRPESPEVGSALRTVYQRTVEEDIPPEMLDLLGKLG